MVTSQTEWIERDLFAIINEEDKIAYNLDL